MIGTETETASKRDALTMGQSSPSLFAARVVREWLASPRAYVVLFFLVFALRIGTALPLQQAGYMDAAYTMHVAENLARGRGFVEDVLWNYLDQPQGLPHPSNLYWMPLPSILVAPFFIVLGSSYRAAQIPFILLSSLLPLFAFYLSKRLYGRDDYAWATALFAAFSGFYLVYWVSPDNFVPFALFGSLCLYAIARGIETYKIHWFFAAGVLAGLAHLSRADGVVFLAVAPLALFLRRNARTMLSPQAFTVHRLPFTVHFSLSTVYCLLGYLLIMTPWFLRNYVSVGSFYPSAGTKTMWLTDYDELFRLADDLTPARYLAWGIGPILASKLQAALIDLVIILFAVLQIFLAPFALIGLLRQRGNPTLLPFFIYSVLFYLIMVFVFTFPGLHGAVLHSGSALLPFFAVAVPPGVDAAVTWVARRRLNWKHEIAAPVFRWGFCILSVVLSLFIYSQGILGPLVGEPGNVLFWNQRDSEYGAIAQWLDQNARPEDILMDVDPPSFQVASQRRSIAIPSDDVQAVVLAATRYGARYMVLRFDHPKPLNALYARTETVPELVEVAEFRDALNRPVTLYEIRRD